MFQVTERSLTPSLLAVLSAGAHKLLNAARLEPEATQARLMALTGYSERSVRKFTTELENAGLAQRIQSGRAKRSSIAERAPEPLSEDAQEVFTCLCTYGLDRSAARRLALVQPMVVVRAAMRYVEARTARNTPGYLIWCLEHVDCWLNASPTVDDPPEATPVILSGKSEDTTTSLVRTDPDPTVPLVVTPENQEAALLAYSVEAATGVDMRLDREAQNTVQQLYQAGYRAEDVACFTDHYWPREDWRGQKGERVTLPALLKGIGAVQHERAAVGDSLRDRVRTLRGHLPERLSITTMGDLWTHVQCQVRVVEDCPDCGRPWSMCLCAERQRPPEYTGEDGRMWKALIGQLQVQLNRATFETWVAPLRLVDYERSAEHDRFTVWVPDTYVRQWLEAKLLPSMHQTLSTLQQRAVHIDLRVDG